jgi:hypothetical protein
VNSKHWKRKSQYLFLPENHAFFPITLLAGTQRVSAYSSIQTKLELKTKRTQKKTGKTKTERACVMRKNSINLQGNSDCSRLEDLLHGAGQTNCGRKENGASEEQFSTFPARESVRPVSFTSGSSKKKKITRREPQRGLQVSDAERSLAHVCLCDCLPSLSVRHSRGREAR